MDKELFYKVPLNSSQLYRIWSSWYDLGDFRASGTITGMRHYCFAEFNGRLEATLLIDGTISFQTEEDAMMFILGWL